MDVTAPAGGGERRSRSRRALLFALAGLAVAVVAVGSVGWWALSTFLPAEATPNADLPGTGPVATAPIAPSPTVAPSVTDPQCPSAVKGPVTWGRDDGDTSSAVSAIKGFNFAYYVSRSGAKARQFVSPTALFGDATQLQRAIDTLPRATTYCLQITDQGAGVFGVTVAEFRPGAPRPRINAEVLTTAESAGRTLITGIPKNEMVSE